MNISCSSLLITALRTDLLLEIFFAVGEAGVMKGMRTL